MTLIDEIKATFPTKTAFAKAIGMQPKQVIAWGDQVPPSRQAQVRRFLELLGENRRLAAALDAKQGAGTPADPR